MREGGDGDTGQGGLDEDQRIARALARALDVPADSITPASSIASLAAWREACQPAVVAELEAEFGLRFDRATGERLVSVPAIRTVLARQQSPAAVPPPSPESPRRHDPEPGVGRVVVLGDDHVASLAKHPAFLPISLGSPWRVNFLTVRQAGHAAAKIAHVVARLPRDAVVVLYFGGALEPLGDASFRAMWQLGNQGQGRLIADALARLLDTAEAIRRRCAGGLAIAALPPAPAGDSQLARRIQDYNHGLAQGCRARQLPWLALGPYLADSDGALRPGFLADGRRLGSMAAAFVVEELLAAGLLSSVPGETRPGPFAWRYGYRRVTAKGALEIPGEDSLGETIADLPLDDFAEPRAGASAPPGAGPAESDVLPRTKACVADMGEVAVLHRLLGEHLGRPLDTLILDGAEGLPAFLHPGEGTNRLVSLDRDPGRIALARRVAALVDRTGIDFSAVVSYRDLPALGGFDLAVVLDRAAAPAAWLRSLAGHLAGTAGAVIYRSRRPEADAALFRQAGFAVAAPVPALGSDGLGYLAEAALTPDGLGEQAGGERLIMAFRQRPGESLLARLRAWLQTGFERHALLLEDRFAARYAAAFRDLGPS